MCRHACPTFLATKLDSHTPRGYALLLAEIEAGKIGWTEPSSTASTSAASAGSAARTARTTGRRMSW